MSLSRRPRHSILASVLAAGLITGLVAPPAMADPFGPRAARDDRDYRGKNAGSRSGRLNHAAPPRRDIAAVDHRGDRRGDNWSGRHYRRPIVNGTVIYVAPDRVRHYRNVIVVRPYGRWYPGYGFYRRDADAWRFLAFTAITLAALNNLNEHQQRTYEQAQMTAASAPIGQTIAWNAAGAAGTVTPLRDGTSAGGAYCREFRQTVTIAGAVEDAYGTACRKPDGAWEVVASGQ